MPDGRLPGADKGSSKMTGNYRISIMHIYTIYYIHTIVIHIYIYPYIAQHIRDIFYRMGFNDQEIVALIGAHSVGKE